MKVEKTNIDGCLIITPDVYKDHRGEYINVYNSKEYDLLLPSGKSFKEDDVSVSHKNVLRGIHGDNRTWKLIQCLHGRFLLGVVDCRINSSTGLWTCEIFELDDIHHKQILVPAGCGNCHYVMTDKSIFTYKQSELYIDWTHQFTLTFNDERLSFDWQKATNNKNFKPIVSERDSKSLEGFHGV